MYTRKQSSTEDSNVEYPLKIKESQKMSITPVSVMVNMVTYQVICEMKELL